MLPLPQHPILEQSFTIIDRTVKVWWHGPWQLTRILQEWVVRLLPQGSLVLALAISESLAEVTQWLQAGENWQSNDQQTDLSRSVNVGPLTR